VVKSISLGFSPSAPASVPLQEQESISHTPVSISSLTPFFTYMQQQTHPLISCHKHKCYPRALCFLDPNASKCMHRQRVGCSCSVHHRLCFRWVLFRRCIGGRVACRRSRWLPLRRRSRRRGRSRLRGRWRWGRTLLFGCGWLWRLEVEGWRS
jgi:hypothetical protein